MSLEIERKYTSPPGFLPPVTGWIETLSHPAVVDTTKAQRELGWSPAWSGLDIDEMMRTSATTFPLGCGKGR